jgi:hypothetical protein
MRYAKYFSNDVPNLNGLVYWFDFQLNKLLTEILTTFHPIILKGESLSF